LGGVICCVVPGGADTTLVTEAGSMPFAVLEQLDVQKESVRNLLGSRVHH
jgi:hypothetical protein